MRQQGIGQLLVQKICQVVDLRLIPLSSCPQHRAILVSRLLSGWTFCQEDVLQDHLRRFVRKTFCQDRLRRFVRKMSCQDCLVISYHLCSFWLHLAHFAFWPIFAFWFIFAFFTLSAPICSFFLYAHYFSFLLPFPLFCSFFSFLLLVAHFCSFCSFLLVLLLFALYAYFCSFLILGQHLDTIWALRGNTCAPFERYLGNSWALLCQYLALLVQYFGATWAIPEHYFVNTWTLLEQYLGAGGQEVCLQCPRGSRGRGGPEKRLSGFAWKKCCIKRSW